MRIEPAGLAKSIGTLTTLEPNEGFPEALQQVVDAAKLLFQADGAGLMLVGKEELLSWASASNAHAERAEAVQADLGAGPCMVAWREQSPVAVRDVEADPRWAEVAPALVAAQLRAALSVPLELAGGPIGTLEVGPGRGTGTTARWRPCRPMPGWWPACCGPPRPPPRGSWPSSCTGRWAIAS